MIPALPQNVVRPAQDIDPTPSSCCDCFVSRIQAIWQAFCSWLTDWANWLFSTSSPAQSELKQKELVIIEAKPKEEAVPECPQAVAMPAPQAKLSSILRFIVPQAIDLNLPSSPPAPAVFVNFTNLLSDIVYHTPKDNVLPDLYSAPDFSIARPLLKAKTALNERSGGQTPLIFLMRRLQVANSRDGNRLNEPTRKAIEQFATELIHAHVELGVSLDEKEVTRWAGGGSALHFAVEGAVAGAGWHDRPVEECFTLAKLLISQGANLEVVDNSGETPLYSALTNIDSLNHFWGYEYATLLTYLLLGQGASLAASYSKSAPNCTLLKIAANPKTRLRNFLFDEVMIKFEADRRHILQECCPFTPPLQNIIIGYLDGVDPWPLCSKLSAQLWFADTRLYPSIRKVILDYTLEPEQITEPPKQKEWDVIDTEMTREDIESHPIGTPDPASVEPTPEAAVLPQVASDEKVSDTETE